jgi:hypothetical protein
MENADEALLLLRNGIEGEVSRYCLLGIDGGQLGGRPDL